MLKNYRQKPNDSLPPKRPNSYHCHLALKDLLSNMLKIKILGLTHYEHHSSSMTVKIDGAYYFQFKLPVIDTSIKDLSASIYKFTNAKELILSDVLLKNTNLVKLKDKHCKRCPQIETCKAFIMNKFLGNE